MNTGKQQTYTAVSVVIDAIVLTVSYVISYLIQFALQNNLAPFDSRNYWPPLMIIVMNTRTGISQATNKCYFYY